MLKKEYIYIVQALLERGKCKIGKTNNLERRLKEYNSITEVSIDNPYKLINDKEYIPYVNGKRYFGRVLVQKM